MSHESRLSKELRALLNAQRVGALGTLGDDGAPYVSMVPFAIDQHHRCLVIHVSALAAHTRNLQERAPVALITVCSLPIKNPQHAFGSPVTNLPGESPDWLSTRSSASPINALLQSAQSQPACSSQ